MFFFTVINPRRRTLVTDDPARGALHQAIVENRAKYPFYQEAVVLYAFDLNVSQFRTLRKVEGAFVCFHPVASTFLGDRNFDICNAMTRLNQKRIMPVICSTWPSSSPPPSELMAPPSKLAVTFRALKPGNSKVVGVHSVIAGPFCLSHEKCGNYFRFKQ
jgi:hypothetical protein